MSRKLSDLHPEVHWRAKAVINLAWEIAIPVLITGTLRTFEEQATLYEQGRTKPGNIVTWAKAGESFHNYGLACFDPNTELLTDMGWKKFTELNKKESIMVYKNGFMWYERPIAYISNNYDGNMVHFKTRSVDILVTPNHKMLVQKKGQKGNWLPWEFIEAKKVSYQHRIPVAGTFIRENEEIKFPSYCRGTAEDWWEFMGYYLSEGSASGSSDGNPRKHNQRFAVSISQSRGNPVWQKIKDCLDKTVHYSAYRGHQFIIHSKELWELLFPIGNSHTKRIPRYLLNAPKNLLNKLFMALINGDGSIYPGHFYYCSASRGLADDFTELSTKLGISCNMNKKEGRLTLLPQGKYIQNLSPLFEVITRKRITHELRNGEGIKLISIEPYKGKVFCVSTKAGAIVIRRNGKISIIGNCDFVPLKDGKPDWKDLEAFRRVGEIGEDLELQWGGRWPKKDRPHLQVSFGFTVHELMVLHSLGGLPRVWTEIDEKIKKPVKTT